jgi:hypothetical protein
MLIYIVLYSLLLFSVVFDRENIQISHKKKAILVFWVIVFTFFRGLRWNTGTDWNQYYHVFLEANWDNIFSYSRNAATHMEIGYMLLNVLIKSIGGDYTLFLLLTNLFVLLAYVKFALTNTKNPIYVFVLFMFSTQFFPVRISIAVAFIIWGLCHFSQRKYKRVIAYTLIAISIHLSAIIFIPAYFLIFCAKIPTKLAVTISVIAMILVQTERINGLLLTISSTLNVLERGEIAHKFENYLDYSLAKQGAIMAIATSTNSIIFIASLIPFGYMINKIDTKQTKINYAFLYNEYVVFVLLGILFSSDQMLGLKRLQNHFVFAFPVLYAAFVFYGKKKYPKWRFGFTVLFVLYALFRSYTLFFGGYPGAYFPYISIFSQYYSK